VGLDQVSGKDLSGSNTTVVRTLGTGESTLGPRERPSIGVEERVLLLESEPGNVLASEKGKSSVNRTFALHNQQRKAERTSLVASIDLLAWYR
jgi:hypothetical protein